MPGLPFLEFPATMRKPRHSACQMPLIKACFRWFASAMRLQSCFQKPSAPLRLAAPPKTVALSRRSSGNWRPLTANSNALGKRYLLRRAATNHHFSVYVYDTRTTLCWRCDFSSQLERNTYVNNLRSGEPSSWPAAIVLQSYCQAHSEHELY